MAKSHIHKFKRLRYKSGNQIYFCALPDCNHKIATPLALGKKSICWRCGDSFEMNEYSIRLAKPHCDKCHKPKLTIDSDVEASLAMPTFESIDAVVEAMEQQDKISERSSNPITDLRSKLNSVHSNLIAKPDDEDI